MTSNKIPKPDRMGDVFHIDFDTEDGPGLLAVKVVLTSAYLKNMDQNVRVDLCCHPLYKKLERYVLANPSSKQ